MGDKVRKLELARGRVVPHVRILGGKLVKVKGYDRKIQVRKSGDEWFAGVPGDQDSQVGPAPTKAAALERAVSAAKESDKENRPLGKGRASRDRGVEDDLYTVDSTRPLRRTISNPDPKAEKRSKRMSTRKSRKLWQAEMERQNEAGGIDAGLFRKAKPLGKGRASPDVSPKQTRPLHEIADEIQKDWGSKVNYAAAPYLDALRQLDSIDSMYYQDSAKSVVAYFLSNAASWRGENAKRIKAELKKMIK